MSQPTSIDPARAPAGALAPRLHPNVLALGIVSMLTDVSSEMIVPVLPLFVTGALAAPVASVGLIEGVAGSVSSLVRLASGWFSDRAGERKAFLFAGYGISGVAKAALALANSAGAVLGLRFADRFGKGIRNPPRDALIADSVPASLHGRAFGLHRALDTAGAAIGPLLAFLLLASFPGDYRRIFLISAIPAVLSLLVLARWVRPPERTTTPAHAAGGQRLASAFKRFLIADGVFQLGNSSVAFVLLRARDAGYSPGVIALIYAGYNVLYAALAYPAGLLTDRIGRRRLLLGAYLLYAAAYGILAGSSTRAAVLGAVAVLGVHSALIEVSQRSLVADLAGEKRGTAFGVYHTVVGLALLPASWAAGWLWDRMGSSAAFTLGAACALIAAVLFVVLLPWHGERRMHARPA